MHEDSTELNDFAEREATRVQQIGTAWFEWASAVGSDPSVFGDVDLIESNYVDISPELRRQYLLH